MRKIAALVSTISSLFVTGIVYAADTTINIEPPSNINTYQDLTPLITNAITIVFAVAALLVFIMLIWGGIQWILSGGDKEAVGKARSRIIHALVGLVILALAFLILRVVGNLIGFDVLGDLKLPGPPTPSSPTPTPR